MKIRQEQRRSLWSTVACMYAHMTVYIYLGLCMFECVYASLYKRVTRKSLGVKCTVKFRINK